jgi:hypothetical protein
MMKKLASITSLWLLCIFMVHAEVPKAGLSVIPLNQGQWPADYRLTLTVPKDHHAYLDTGDENVLFLLRLIRMRNWQRIN